MRKCSVVADGEEASREPEGSTDRTLVVGTQTCERNVDSDLYLEDGTEVMQETFTCDTDMSDPRASGREVLHIETTFLEPDDMTAAWTGDGTLTNDEGSWTTETVEGVVDLEWANYNKGELVYVGQGAYEGLTLHLLVTGTNEQLTYVGWIERSE